MNNVKRIFVEKKPGFDVEAQNLMQDLKESLHIKGLKSIRLLNRYDISGLETNELNDAVYTIFSEKTVDNVYFENVETDENDKVFAIEYLPGQYDQRADSASQCVQIITQSEKPNILSSKVYIVQGDITEGELDKIKDYCINPVDSREASIEKPNSLEMEVEIPEDVMILEGFNEMTREELNNFLEENGLAMSLEDLAFCQEYFNKERRNPSITEIKVIDTYWSDHCRHTTFMTQINNVEIEDSHYSVPIKNAFNEYIKSREFVYGNKDRAMCLMDIAVIGMKELKKKGMLNDLDESDEINACSIVVNAEIDGKNEEWLVMFKNETHNHPTEIEPFGGAATCLGGAIRDPLSGRSYVYQAMRVTGSGDPRVRIEDTLKGKLPQKKITQSAAHGYSSYGNQIGLATGQVAEIYDNGYIAKRMEVGAVIGAAPKKNVVRLKPVPTDVVILVGGRTGRDGCGGATGSSKKHTETSILTCGSEVQKGNAPTERKIQRLFRDPKVSTLIKKCNDFGAGGVSVAIGELTDGLNIDLDKVNKKYEGLDGTELAISESQERMAVLVSKDDADKFIKFAEKENLEAAVVAEVVAENRLKMNWRGKTIVDLSRDFLNTNGIRQNTDVFVKAPKYEDYFFKKEDTNLNLEDQWKETLKDLNICSQKGLSERFDSTVGAGTVLMPFGGKYQSTPTEGMAAKLPVLNGETTTGTLMTYGFNPDISKWSPFHGAMYSVLEAVAKITACGGDYSKVRLSFQEYFEKLGTDKEKWGKPFAALLGGLYAQQQFGIAAIGGKDSMSGTFKDISVPPTLVAFAVDTVNVNNVISPEFKEAGNKVILINAVKDEYGVPDFESIKRSYTKVNELIKTGAVISAMSIKRGGICEALSKMCFGNKIGVKFSKFVEKNSLFLPNYGSIIIELKGAEEELKDINYKVIGLTQDKPSIDVNEIEIKIDSILPVWEETLENIFPSKKEYKKELKEEICYLGTSLKTPVIKVAKPKVVIPVFPGTNCEYDSARAFKKAGAEVDTFVFNNLTAKNINESVDEMTRLIKESQIVMIPGGFSAGDEPDGSGKFIAAVFRNPKIKDAVMELLNNRDGLMLGVCNGFQALIKLGLVPYGEIRDIDVDCPTLTYNKIGRHISHVVTTKVVSKLSPWLNNVELGDMHSVPVSHGEGRFVINEALMKELIDKGQIATQYVDLNGKATYDSLYNLNGSDYSVEGITSPDGRVFGKMAHSERIGDNILKNISGNKDQKIFEAGVKYFK
ncbi:MAG: phosphoribosylformylglycinamidine synthase [Solirubrobacterales bacterium]